MNPIILEGPDGAGKSTLAARLRELGYVVQAFGVPPKEAQKSEEGIFQFFLQPLLDYTNLSIYPGGRIVFDRLHLSDQIYGNLMRGGSPMTYRAEAMIERYVEAIDGQIVICLPPYRTAFRNWLGRREGHEYVKDAIIYDQVYKAYAKLLFSQKRNRNFIWYDYTRHHVGGFASALTHYRGQSLAEAMVGSQRPRFLFIGEQANTKYDLPFMTTENCSGWFFDVVKDAGYKEHEIAFVNAKALTGEPSFTESWIHGIARGGVMPIALGEVAKAAVNGVCTYCHVDHPQYVKRFEAKRRSTYVRQLANIRRNYR